MSGNLHPGGVCVLAHVGAHMYVCARTCACACVLHSHLHVCAHVLAHVRALVCLDVYMDAYASLAARWTRTQHHDVDLLALQYTYHELLLPQGPCGEELKRDDAPV
jgi:hypothetical protein